MWWSSLMKLSLHRKPRAASPHQSSTPPAAEPEPRPAKLQGCLNLPPIPALRPTPVELNQDQLASLWLSHGTWDVKCKPAQPFLRLCGAGINSSTCLPLTQEVWLLGCILRDNHSNVHSCIYKDAYHNIVCDGEKPENIYMSINRGLIK